LLAENLEAMPCISKELQNIRPCTENGKGLPQKAVSYKGNVSNRMSAAVYSSAGAEYIEEAYELGHQEGAELMRTRYCIRYELGMCPKHHGVKDSGPLFLLNNGQKFSLHFDCRSCEMTLN
jgi:putative protease